MSILEDQDVLFAIKTEEHLPIVTSRGFQRRGRGDTDQSR